VTCAASPSPAPAACDPSRPLFFLVTWYIQSVAEHFFSLRIHPPRRISITRTWYMDGLGLYTYVSFFHRFLADLAWLVMDGMGWTRLFFLFISGMKG